MQDLGEKMGCEPISHQEKYYPTVHLPIKIDPGMVGKTIELKLKAKVVDVKVGEKKSGATLELLSCLNKTKKKGNAVYIQPWMDKK